MKEVSCPPNLVCSVELRVDAVVLGCFADGNGGWLPGTPQSIIDSCEPTDAYCYVVTNPAHPYDCFDGCPYCQNICDPYDSVYDCCNCYPVDLAPEDPLDFGYDPDGVLQAISDSCNGIEGFPHVGEQQPDGTIELYHIPSECANPTPLFADCELYESSFVPGAEYYFEIDSAHSYLAVVGAEDTTTLSVKGWSALNTSPNGFIKGYFWVDDGVHDGQSVQDWVFLFDHPIEVMLSTGQITVPPGAIDASGLRGRGTYGSDTLLAAIDVTNAAYGTINPSASTWSMNYGEADSVGSIRVHLQGTADQSWQ